MTTVSSPALSPALALRAPSLENQDAGQWALHREIAYLFARHARHDIINVQCALQLMEVVEKMREMGSSIPLPPELQPDQVEIKVQQSIKQMVSMTNDLVLLSQAASPAAYRQAHTLTLREIWDAAVTARLGKQSDRSATLPQSPAVEDRIVVLGDMLPAAVAAFFYQWTPWLRPLAGRSCFVERRGREVVLAIPAVDAAMVQGFTDKLAAQTDTDGHPVLHNPRTTPTGEMALWIARFILLLHGGDLMVTLDDGPGTLRIRLPVAM